MKDMTDNLDRLASILARHQAGAIPTRPVQTGPIGDLAEYIVNGLDNYNDDAKKLARCLMAVTGGDIAALDNAIDNAVFNKELDEKPYKLGYIVVPCAGHKPGQVTGVDCDGDVYLDGSDDLRRLSSNLGQRLATEAEIRAWLATGPHVVLTLEQLDEYARHA